MRDLNSFDVYLTMIGRAPRVCETVTRCFRARSLSFYHVCHNEFCLKFDNASCLSLRNLSGSAGQKDRNSESELLQNWLCCSCQVHK